MTQALRHAVARAALGVAMLMPAVATAQAQQGATRAPVVKHHSKIKGAIVGAAAGHVLGGHAKAGAAAGALWQHHKNKKAARAK